MSSERPARLLDVGLHRLGGSARVMSGDRVDHSPMLGQNLDAAFGDADRVEACEPDDPAQGEQDPARPLQAEECRDGEVELLVGLDELRWLGGHLRLAVEDPSELGDVGVGRLLREQAHDVRLDQVAQLEGLPPLVVGDRAQPEAALRNDLDQSLSLELDQRLKPFAEIAPERIDARID
jgi:hypothetical protein